MLRYIVRRVLGAIPLLLGIATIIFFVLHIAPGDPTAFLFGSGVPPEVIAQVRSNYGLDQPVPVQYVHWIGALARGEFGWSLTQQGREVSSIIAEALPNTLTLTLSTLVLVFVIGVLVGVYQAVRQYSFGDNVLSVVGLFFYSMPSFWLAMMLVLIFALLAHRWGLPALPATGITSFDYGDLSFTGRIIDRTKYLILPVTTLTLALMAGVARYARGQMLEVIRQDYVRTARAKGLPERTVILRHALRNSMIPVITLLGLYLPFLFSGAVFVEYIFAWPGMGRVIVDAILQRDYPVIMATSFIFAALTIGGNLVADILYAWADPRIRYD